MALPIKNVQVKFTNEEHAEIYETIRNGNHDSFQAVCHDLMVEWARGNRKGPIHELTPLMKLAGEFEQATSRPIREWVTDTMKRFIKLGQKDGAERPRKKAS